MKKFLEFFEQHEASMTSLVFAIVLLGIFAPTVAIFAILMAALFLV